jgi:nicotinic acid phosphoribosyltransferase
MVGDCYDYWHALENDLIPLVQKAQEDGSGRTVVARPDSGDSIDMVVGTLQRARGAGLMAEHLCADGVTRHVSTTLRYIVGNGESFETVLNIINAGLAAGFVPWRCGIYGVGGHLRNNINRDHLSTKFALCSVGSDNRPVIKLSNTPGKQTLPECKVLRDELALATGVTLVTPSELGDDALVPYYDGSLDEPFGTGFTDEFTVCENRVIQEFDTMPETAGQRSEGLQEEVDNLIKHYRG